MGGSVGVRARRMSLALTLCLVAVFLVACSAAQEPAATTEPAVETSEVILASTTSTQDSGLFDGLVPAFEASNPEYLIKVVAVGTGEALTLGENKDADVLLVHAKSSEEEFVAAGFGVERQDVMYNDFVVVGPADDPAGIGEAASAADAFAAIRDSGSVFYSRGDDSGTHKKELKIWAAAGIDEPSGDWYLVTGQGMGDTLKIASEKQAYTLTDRATYLSLKDALDSEVAFEGADDLFNQYGVIVITEATNQAGGQAFADWIVSDEGQAVIRDFGVDTYGQALFVPNAQ